MGLMLAMVMTMVPSIYVRLDKGLCVMFQAQTMITEYQSAKSGYTAVLGDAGEIEHRAHDAGIQLVKAEEQAGSLQEHIQQLKELTTQHEDMLKDINKVSSVIYF